MPELLEVEYFRRLAERCAGRTILHIDVPAAHALADGRSPRSLRQAVVGRRIELARRHGKLLVLETDGPALGLRFGMTGGLVVDGELAIDRLLYSPGTFGTAWVRFGIRFDEGELLFHDPRRFGRVSLDPDESRMGPDAMAVTAAELGRALATRGPAPGPALKARLLDQSAIAGIGNLLGDEILWRASLAPSRPARSLAPAELRRLHRHLVATLADLLERGGSHTGDLMAERHLGGRCPKDGSPLERSTVGGRTTWWCPRHQH